MTFDCYSPRHAILGKGFPFSYTYLAGPEVPFHYISESALWASDGLNPSSKVAIKKHFWYLNVRHALHMSEPVEPSLPKESLHLREVALGQNISVGDLLLPLDVEDSSKLL